MIFIFFFCSFAFSTFCKWKLWTWNHDTFFRENEGDFFAFYKKNIHVWPPTVIGETFFVQPNKAMTQSRWKFLGFFIKKHGISIFFNHSINVGSIWFFFCKKVTITLLQIVITFFEMWQFHIIFSKDANIIFFMFGTENQCFHVIGRFVCPKKGRRQPLIWP